MLLYLFMIPLLGIYMKITLESGNQQERKHSLIELKVGIGEKLSL